MYSQLTGVLIPCARPLTFTQSISVKIRLARAYWNKPVFSRPIRCGSRMQAKRNRLLHTLHKTIWPPRATLDFLPVLEPSPTFGNHAFRITASINRMNHAWMTQLDCIGILYSDSEFMDLTPSLILAPCRGKERERGELGFKERGDGRSSQVICI